LALVRTGNYRWHIWIQWTSLNDARPRSDGGSDGNAGEWKLPRWRPARAARSPVLVATAPALRSLCVLWNHGRGETGDSRRFDRWPKTGDALCFRASRSPPRSLAPTVTPAVGIDADAEGAAVLIKELEGKDVEEVIAAGREKLQSVGGGVAVAGGAGGAAAAGGAAPAAEEKVEEEEDEDMGFSLFD